MNKIYNLITWHNGTTPAINEDNLNAMSEALDGIDDRVVELGGDLLEVIPQIQAYLDQADDLVEALETLSQNPPYIGANGNWFVWDTNTSQFVDSGIDASITVQIADVTAIGPDETPYVTNTGTNTDPIFHLFIPRGQTGSAGNGIASITKTSSSGNVDTYTILYTNGNTDTFTVTNGTGGVSNLSQLQDVTLTSLTNNDLLQYDSTATKWKNISSLSKSFVGLSNVDNTSDASKPISTATQTALDAKASNTDVNNKHKVTTLSVDTTNWNSDTTSQSGTTLYKKQVTLSHVYVDEPSIDVGAGTGYVLPTTSEQESYDLIQYATVDSSVPCLYLYAESAPTTAFYIKVEGVD